MLKIFNRQNLLLLLFFLGGYFLNNISTAVGQFGDYKPKKNHSHEIEQKASLGSGSRSHRCEAPALANSIKLLVPAAEVVHTTVSSQPSFYVQSQNKSSIQVEFTLVDPYEEVPLVQMEIGLNKGIKKIDLPSNITLQKNKIFLWNIAIPCLNDSLEYYDVLSAGIKRVSASPELLVELKKYQSESNSYAIYARNGIWYDALKYAFGNTTTDNNLINLLISAGVKLDANRNIKAIY